VSFPVAAEARTLLSMLQGQPRRGSHAERLQAFYSPQAGHYDRFRERLLKGRRELLARLPLSDSEVLIELGAGTGRNLEFLGNRINRLARVELIDLCPALLDRARSRAAAWPHVTVVEADVTHYLPSQPADCVLLSYALTMIPDWRAALGNAIAMLKPGGRLAVVDFCVSARQPRWLRHFWQRWFAHDGVHLSVEHIAALCIALPDHECEQHFAPMPYLPALRVPYYLFLGTKPSHQ
jgi:S-adenosylmethionine-diacylgycerolhomoserine-N-methlytransferase